MLKLLLISALLAVAAAKKHTCSLSKGKVLRSFSTSREDVKFGCKFHAIRGTECGKYTLTITPGLALSLKNKKHVYVLDNMFISLTRNDGETLKVRMDNKTVEKYIEGTKDSPINWKNGSLNISDVYNVKHDSKKKVTVEEKNEVFIVNYELNDGKDPKTSEFTFECNDDHFVPKPFPDQLCGNGSVREVKAYKKEIGFQGNRVAVLVRSVFTTDITQTGDCKVAQEAMTDDCEGNQLTASELCFPITYDSKSIKCLKDKGSTFPKSAFANCVKFACSGFTDTESCKSLKQQTEDCNHLKDIAEKIEEVCPDESDSEE